MLIFLIFSDCIKTGQSFSHKGAGNATLPQPESSDQRRLEDRMSYIQNELDEYLQTLLSPTSSAISMFAPSTVPRSKPPFKQNFMLDVPDASVPAVEMCWLRSEAGMSISARETE